MSTLLIADPDEYDLSQPQSLAHLCQRTGATRVLWSDEAESEAGVNYLRYREGRAPVIGARELDVCEISRAEAAQFYQRTHLQGSCNGFCHLALKDQDGHVKACMSFAMPHVCRSNNNAFLLQRFSSQGAVSGGASRLLAAFRESFTGPIRTFSDTRYASGQLYTTLGFHYVQSLRPDYRYRRDGRWFAKNTCQKKHLLAEGATPGTEAEMARQLGYVRCYDLGKRVWELND